MPGQLLASDALGPAAIAGDSAAPASRTGEIADINARFIATSKSP